MSRIFPTTLDNQQTIFEEIDWQQDSSAPLIADKDIEVTGRPPGLVTGLPATADEELENRRPYWEFTYRIDSTRGLVIKNVVARGTQHSTTAIQSEERVFQEVDFTDLQVTFDDGSIAMFDVARALSSAPPPTFKLMRGGKRQLGTVAPPDPLIQYGLLLSLTDNVAQPAGSCYVTLDFVFVVRGAINDFDPGGVPVAMGCYPQLAWKWLETRGSTRRVTRFRGSVRITVDNVMADAHTGHGGVSPPKTNSAGLYSDSNSSFQTLGNASPAVVPKFPGGINIYALIDNRSILYGIAAMAGRQFGKPASWGMLFDYMHANFKQEKEFVAVYGPEDKNFHRQTVQRRANYLWPTDGVHTAHNRYVIIKTDRQGQYDNVHLHADMGRRDVNGQEQIHAPFCGHSCVHMHWRWSATAAAGATERSWYYSGWSPFGPGMPKAHTTKGAPLIPPNQRLTVAICKPRPGRFSTEQILDPNSLEQLPERNKMIWYCADIVTPAPGQKQVICKHGLGWAYRYAMPNESDAVKGLCRPPFRPIRDDPPATQQQMSDYFENVIYPAFRYVDWHGTKLNQIPDGSFEHTHVWGSDTPDKQVKAEDL